MTERSYPNRLKELREKANLTLEQLAQQVGTSNQQVSMLERGKRQLNVRWMEKLAGPLGVKPAELIEIATTDHKIKLVGEVQAGVWKTAEELEDFEVEVFDLPLPEAYRGLRPYALRVRGPSMNAVYPEGTILICCHLEDLREQPICGKRYIIEDIDPHGAIECTVKEFQLDLSGRPWAWPRSNDPLFQAPVALDTGRNGHTIRLKSRVVFTLRIE